MTKLIMPLLSQDARGSVSGIQFSRNRSGCFGSRKSTSTRAQKGESTNWRATIKRAHSAFDALTDAEKLSWAAWTPPGQTVRSHYIGSYLRLATTAQLPDPTHPSRTLRATLKNIVLIAPTPPSTTWFMSWGYDGDSSSWMRVQHHASWGDFPHIHDRKWRVVIGRPTDLRSASFKISARAPYHQFLISTYDWRTGKSLWQVRIDDDPVQAPAARLKDAWSMWTLDQKAQYTLLWLEHPEYLLNEPPDENLGPIEPEKEPIEP